MKPAPFQLELPTTVDEAVGVLSEHGDDAKVLAGGQSLVPLLALRLARFERLVDLNRIDSLRGIRVEDGWLAVGAMTRQAEAERSVEVAAVAPLLHRALPHIGHFQIRNRGTVGGSTAHGDPASELPAVAVALDADLVAVGAGGRRTIPARNFFRGIWTTALEDGEILAEIRYPAWGDRAGFAVEEFARRSGDFAIAGVACAVAFDQDDRIARAAVALFGMGATPLRALAAESALVGSFPTEVDLEALGRAAVDDTDPTDDLHGDARFRRRVAAHLTQRALRSALKEASNA